MPHDPHHFFFEIDRAIRTQVVEKLEASPELELTESVAPQLKGVYALYRKGQLVYAGKALHTTLRRRLAEHARKIAGRDNVSLDEITCRFLTIDSDWFVRAAEDALITNYKPLWNLSGFGSHVPGKGRPGIRMSKWDKDFPLRKPNVS
ncbi:MAG TPA: Eco29kI family restriction endonuclease [Nitrospira sp.]|nr:Eco29kI family restriction endonuclease [Nitrospira sp.]